jgi:hypothetical protein
MMTSCSPEGEARFVQRTSLLSAGTGGPTEGAVCIWGDYRCTPHQSAEAKE